MLKFEIRKYKDFTQEELKKFGFENPDEGYLGNEYAYYLVVLENENIIYMMNDDIAPEDVSMRRGLDITDLLQMVYEKGIVQGVLNTVDKMNEKKLCECFSKKVGN